MAKTYTLDQTIEALNLLDQYDDDFFLVKSKLNIPIKTLRGWRADQENLRRKYDDRQFRHFANLKHTLLNDMFESAGDIMKQIKSGDHPGIAVSQLTNALDTLLRNARQLEETYVHLAPNPSSPADQPNQWRFVDHHIPPNTPRRTDGDSGQSGPLQSSGLRQALGQIGARQN